MTIFTNWQYKHIFSYTHTYTHTQTKYTSSPNEANEGKAFYIGTVDFLNAMDIDTESENNTKKDGNSSIWCFKERTGKPYRS